MPIFSAGMRPLATIFSRVGMDTGLAAQSGAAHRCHFPLSEITRGSQVPLRNAVPADAPGRSHARWDGRRVIGGNGSLPPITGLFLTRRSHLGGATSASADAMGTSPAMPDELSVDVFTELRRVTSAGDQARGLRRGPLSWRPGHAPRPVMRQWSGWNMSVRRSSGSTPPCTPRWVARSRDRSEHRFHALGSRSSAWTHG